MIGLEISSVNEQTKVLRERKQLFLDADQVRLHSIERTPHSASAIVERLLLDIDGVLIKIPGTDRFDYTDMKRGVTALNVIQGLVYTGHSLWNYINPIITPDERDLIAEVQEELLFSQMMEPSMFTSEVQRQLALGFDNPIANRLYMEVLALSTRIPDNIQIKLRRVREAGVEIGIVTDSPFPPRTLMMLRRFPDIFEPKLVFAPDNLLGRRKKQVAFYEQVVGNLEGDISKSVYIEDFLPHLRRSLEAAQWQFAHASPGHTLGNILSL